MTLLFFNCRLTCAGLLKPMSKGNPTGGQLVLAGDPKQLGPILRSPLAKKHGLGKKFSDTLACNQHPFFS